VDPGESLEAAHTINKFLCLRTTPVGNVEDETAIHNSGVALIKTVSFGFDSRETHNEKPLYITNNKSVLKNALFGEFSICPDFWAQRTLEVIIQRMSRDLLTGDFDVNPSWCGKVKSPTAVHSSRRIRLIAGGEQTCVHCAHLFPNLLDETEMKTFSVGRCG
jgi:hypothetical protein